MTISQEDLDYVLGLEARAESWADHSHMSSVFRDAANQLAEEDPRRQYLIWEIWVHDYHLSHDQAEKGLMLVMGGQAYPVAVETFPEDAVEYFRRRLATSRRSATRARLADFLWLRTKQIAFADQAIAEYLTAVPDILPSTRGRSMACDYLGRAAHLVLSLQRDATPLLAAIRSLAGQFLADEDGHLSGLLMATRDAIDLDPSLGSWLVEQTTALASKRAAPPEQSRILERGLLDALLPLAVVRKNGEQARELRLRIARSFEAEAVERKEEGGLIESAFLQKAIKAYQDLGLGEEVDRLKPLIHEASKKAEQNLHTISSEFTIPVEQFQRQVEMYLEAGRKHSPAAHLQMFAIGEGLWPPWSKVSEQTAELQRRFPLQALVTKVTISDDGRPFERPADPEKRREFDEIEHYLQDIRLRLQFAARKVAMFRERLAWSEELIMQALARGVLFKDDVLKSVRPGIRAFEEGRHWEALHVLVPQIERSIRSLARSLGAPTYRYVSETGELQWASLKSLLAEPAVVAVLGKIRPDLARELKYLLVDSRGGNVRDEVCHGIVHPDADAPGLSFLCVLIMLTLSILTATPPIGSTGATAKEDSGPDNG